jgi:hypothetical protein
MFGVQPLSGPSAGPQGLLDAPFDSSSLSPFRAPESGRVAPNPSRNVISPGISVSAIAISPEDENRQ